MKAFVAIGLLGCIVRAHAVSFMDVVLEDWEAYKLEHGEFLDPFI